MTKYRERPGNAERYRNLFCANIFCRFFFFEVYGRPRSFCRPRPSKLASLRLLRHQLLLCHVSFTWRLSDLSFAVTSRVALHAHRASDYVRFMGYKIRFVGEGVCFYTFLFSHLIHQSRCFIADSRVGWINYNHLCYALRQVHSLFQTMFSSEWDLVFPLLVSGILSFA